MSDVPSDRDIPMETERPSTPTPSDPPRFYHPRQRIRGLRGKNNKGKVERADQRARSPTPEVIGSKEALGVLPVIRRTEPTVVVNPKRQKTGLTVTETAQAMAHFTKMADTISYVNRQNKKQVRLMEHQAKEAEQKQALAETKAREVKDRRERDRMQHAGRDEGPRGQRSSRAGPHAARAPIDGNRETQRDPASPVEARSGGENSPRRPTLDGKPIQAVAPSNRQGSQSISEHHRLAREVLSVASGGDQTPRSPQAIARRSPNELRPRAGFERPQDSTGSRVDPRVGEARIEAQHQPSQFGYSLRGAQREDGRDGFDGGVGRRLAHQRHAVPPASSGPFPPNLSASIEDPNSQRPPTHHSFDDTHSFHTASPTSIPIDTQDYNQCNLGCPCITHNESRYQLISNRLQSLHSDLHKVQNVFSSFPQSISDQIIATVAPALAELAHRQGEETAARRIQFETIEAQIAKRFDGFESAYTNHLDKAVRDIKSLYRSSFGAERLDDIDLHIKDISSSVSGLLRILPIPERYLSGDALRSARPTEDPHSQEESNLDQTFDNLVPEQQPSSTPATHHVSVKDIPEDNRHSLSVSNRLLQTPETPSPFVDPTTHQSTASRVRFDLPDPSLTATPANANRSIDLSTLARVAKTDASRLTSGERASLGTSVRQLRHDWATEDATFQDAQQALLAGRTPEYILGLAQTAKMNPTDDRPFEEPTNPADPRSFPKADAWAALGKFDGSTHSNFRGHANALELFAVTKRLPGSEIVSNLSFTLTGYAAGEYPSMAAELRDASWPIWRARLDRKFCTTGWKINWRNKMVHLRYPDSVMDVPTKDRPKIFIQRAHATCLAVEPSMTLASFREYLSGQVHEGLWGVIDLHEASNVRLTATSFTSLFIRVGEANLIYATSVAEKDSSLLQRVGKQVSYQTPISNSQRVKDNGDSSAHRFSSRHERTPTGRLTTTPLGHVVSPDGYRLNTVIRTKDGKLVVCHTCGENHYSTDKICKGKKTSTNPFQRDNTGKAPVAAVEILDEDNDKNDYVSAPEHVVDQTEDEDSHTPEVAAVDFGYDDDAYFVDDSDEILVASLDVQPDPPSENESCIVSCQIMPGSWPQDIILPYSKVREEPIVAALPVAQDSLPPEPSLSQEDLDRLEKSSASCLLMCCVRSAIALQPLVNFWAHDSVPISHLLWRRSRSTDASGKYHVVCGLHSTRPPD